MFQNIHKLALFFILFNSNLKRWIGKLEGFLTDPQAYVFPNFRPEILNNDAFDMKTLQHRVKTKHCNVINSILRKICLKNLSGFCYSPS